MKITPTGHRLGALAPALKQALFPAAPSAMNSPAASACSLRSPALDDARRAFVRPTPLVSTSRTLLALVLALALTAQTTGCGNGERQGVHECEPSDDVGDDTFESDATADTAPPLDTTPEPDTTPQEDTGPVTIPVGCPWQLYNTGLTGGRIASVDFDARNPNVAYASTGTEVFRSSNGGLTWAAFSEDVPPLKEMAFPAGDQKQIIAIGSGGLFESIDSGSSFEVKALGGLDITSMLLHPASAQRVYVGTSGAGIMRSDSGGSTFKPVNVRVPYATIQSFVGDPEDVDVVVAAVALLTETGGRSQMGQIIRTVDGGATWDVALDGVKEAVDLAQCPADPAIVYGALRNGVAKSTDGGATWAMLDAFEGLDVLQIEIAEDDCNTLYTLIYREAIYRSNDGGQTAQGPFATGLNLEVGRITGILRLNPTDSERLFLATHGGLYISTDAGETWNLQNAGEGVAPSSLSVSAADPDRLWLSTWGAGVWMKEGRDADWQRVSTQSLPRDFTFTAEADPTDGDTIYVSASPELFRSTDGGANFEALDLRVNVMDLLFVDGSSEIIVGSQQEGLLQSTDEGMTFSDLNGSLEPWTTPAGERIDVRDLVADPDDPDRMWIGTRGRGVFRTDDRGQSWIQAGAAIDSEQVMKLLLIGGDALRLVAIIRDKGIYISDDEGETWTVVDDGLESAGVLDIVANPDTGAIYAALADDSVYELAEDSDAWQPFDRFCLPFKNFGKLAVIGPEGSRSLVGIGGANIVVIHDL